MGGTFYTGYLAKINATNPPEVLSSSPERDEAGIGPTLGTSLNTTEPQIVAGMLIDGLRKVRVFDHDQACGACSNRSKLITLAGE